MTRIIMECMRDGENYQINIAMPHRLRCMDGIDNNKVREAVIQDIDELKLSSEPLIWFKLEGHHQVDCIDVTQLKSYEIKVIEEEI